MIICGKCSISIQGGGRIVLEPNSRLLIGINYSYPVPCVIDLHGGKLIVSGNVCLNRGSKICVFNDAKFHISNNTYINECAKIYCAKNITIGKNCAIGFDVKILDTDTHYIYVDNGIVNENEGIDLGDNVWIGTNTTVLKGTHIENNTIVGAHSLVKGVLSSGTVYAGVPVKPIMKFNKWGN